MKNLNENVLLPVGSIATGNKTHTSCLEQERNLMMCATLNLSRLHKMQ